MTKLENGRDNQEMYVDFLRISLKQVTGAKKWASMVKSITMLMDEVNAVDGNVNLISQKILDLKCWTHSDEALLVTLVANNIKVWVSRYQRQSRGSTSTRFTKIVVSAERNKTKTSREWSMEGIAYYNARIKDIKEKIEEDTSFDVEFLKSLRVDSPNSQKGKSGTNDQPAVVQTIFDNELDAL